jgi:hypothetical protein
LNGGQKSPDGRLPPNLLQEWLIGPADDFHGCGDIVHPLTQQFPFGQLEQQKPAEQSSAAPNSRVI